MLPRDNNYSSTPYSIVVGLLDVLISFAICYVLPFALVFSWQIDVGARNCVLYLVVVKLMLTLMFGCDCQFCYYGAIPLTTQDFHIFLFQAISGSVKIFCQFNEIVY